MSRPSTAAFISRVSAKLGVPYIQRWATLDGRRTQYDWYALAFGRLYIVGGQALDDFIMRADVPRTNASGELLLPPLLIVDGRRAANLSPFWAVLEQLKPTIAAFLPTPLPRQAYDRAGGRSAWFESL